MIETIKDIISTFKWGIGQMVALAFVVGGLFAFIFAFLLVINWGISSLSNLLILGGVCLVIILTSLYHIVKIIRNPKLTKKQKWDRLFGKY